MVIGSREQLLHLLAEASEIEHTLMCGYLDAAFSLKRKGETGLARAEADAAESWRKTIMSVAIEERRGRPCDLDHRLPTIALLRK